MLKNQQIDQYFKKVQNSQCFSKAVVVKELFKYLVEKSVNGHIPKEFEIAYEVFGKSPNQTKEINIRIYIHNLRKKLLEYYQKEGLNDEVVFSIPKGGYQVSFNKNRKVFVQSRLARFSPYILGLSLVVFLFSIVVFTSRDRTKVSRSFMWEDVYNSRYPLLIILGDHYFVNVRNVLGRMAPTRLVEINSDEEFDGLLEKNPEASDDLKKTEQTYINKQAPFGLYKIMSFLGGGQIDIDMRYSSTLEWEHLEGKNTLFIGSYKTQDILKQVHEKIGITYQINESKLFYQVADSTFMFGSGRGDFLDTEYATFSHFQTRDGRIVMALMCNSDVGNIATIKHLSKAENLKELEQFTRNFSSDNFKAVFEVRGHKQTDFEITLKRIDQIDENIDEIWPL